MGIEGPYRIMISGGGTGGHIFPAISIAQSLCEMLDDVQILFVGAKGKMEMEKVPEAGFDIEGLWISGIQRSISFRNFLFPLKLVVSIWKSFQLLRRFKPNVVVGVGGYASGPLLYAATVKKIPTLIQEQNSYAGLTNKWLAGRVDKICVAYDEMERYFPKGKIKLLGNPIRKGLVLSKEKISEAYDFFRLDREKPTILVIGGSLGSRTINESVLAGLPKIIESGVQLIWQTGGFYFSEMALRSKDEDLSSIRIYDFIREMHFAYALADIVISRAGALALAELMVVGKSGILVPSPNVAEDHQTKNAMALVKKDAALMVKDSEAVEKLIPEAIRLLKSEEEKEKMNINIKALAHPDASRDIANAIIKMVA